MWRLYKVFAILIFFTLSSRLLGQARIELIDSNKADCSFRGLSVVTDKVVWVSGSRGTVGRSVDGGTTWTWVKVAGFEKSDFRDIEAFDENRAVIMASGTPAVILKTVDGGKTWKLVFKDERPEMFLDAMDFWDEKHGMMVGDPINGRFVLLETKDGGDSWKLWDTTFCPAALDSEAVFAASGTSLCCFDKNNWAFVTGGSVSRLIFWHDCKSTYINRLIGFSNGKGSQGGFSLVFKHGFYVAGGDYLSDTVSVKKFAYFPRSMKWCTGLKNDPVGYRSSVALLPHYRYIVTGTSGTELATRQNVASWVLISTVSFNVVRKAKKGNAVFLAGGKGRIGKLIY